MVIHWVSGFPVSLPWWSFAIGIGFSAVDRDILRPLPRHQGIAAGSDRSVEIRVALCQRSTSRSTLMHPVPAPTMQTLRPASDD